MGYFFDFVLLVLKRHRSRLILIENVPKLMRQDGGKTWAKIEEKLQGSGYDVRSKKISPLDFGVPQGRDRAIIVGRLKSLGSFEWPESTPAAKTDLRNLLDQSPPEARRLSEQYRKYLSSWDDLLSQLPKDANISAFPLWAAEFGATYPYEGAVPLGRDPQSLLGAKGSFGKGLIANRSIVVDNLPPYARIANGEFPAWKQEFIRANRKFYDDHKDIIKAWLPKIVDFPPSFQKLEWNWKGGDFDLYKGLVQFRASGIRVRRPDVAPSLVALTASQVPVVPWEGRYLTIRECARLQSMGEFKTFPSAEGAAFKALGNAVNVTVIRRVAESLLSASD